MLKDGRPIGAIAIARSQIGCIPARQIELLRTFADQAVIAIENVRLFDEVQARSAELIQSLEQRTATSEVLKVIRPRLASCSRCLKPCWLTRRDSARRSSAICFYTTETRFGQLRCMARRLHGPRRGNEIQ